MDHVVIRKLEHLSRAGGRPDIGFVVETRDRPGPAHKNGAFPDDRVWLQLQGGFFVAKARVDICWVGEYSSVGEIRARTQGSTIYDFTDFWRGRPRFGYAAVARVTHESWIEPFWGGPRTYGYEWVVLETDSKRKSWLDPKDPPRSGDALVAAFNAFRNA